MTNPSNGAHVFPSAEWTEAFREAVNNNETYRTMAKEWRAGAVAMVVRPAPDKGAPEGASMLLDVHEGNCRAATYTPRADSFEETPFVITADYDAWVRVMRGELDPIEGMMSGKLALERGHLPTMIRFVEASRSLVKSAAAVPTTFSYELSEGAA